MLNGAITAIGAAAARAVGLIDALLFVGAISLRRRRERGGRHGVFTRASFGTGGDLASHRGNALCLGLGVVLVTGSDLVHELAGSLADLVAGTGRGIRGFAENTLLVRVTGYLVAADSRASLVGTGLGLVRASLDGVLGATVNLAAAKLGAARLVEGQSLNIAGTIMGEGGPDVAGSGLQGGVDRSLLLSWGVGRARISTRRGGVVDLKGAGVGGGSESVVGAHFDSGDCCRF